MCLQLNTHDTHCPWNDDKTHETHETNTSTWVYLSAGWPGTMTRQVFIPGVETGRYSLLFISRGSHIICIVLEYVYVKAKCVVKTKSSNNLLNINSLGDIFSCNRV